MKPRFIASLVFVLALMPFAAAQITTEKGSASDLTNMKIHKLDLLIKLIPLALRKDQYSDLLTGIEKGRQLARHNLETEDAELAAMDGEIGDAITAAIEKGQYPTHDLQNKVGKQLASMENRRVLILAQMTIAVYNAIQTKLNAGQRKVMAGSFADSYIKAGAKPGEIPDEVKIRFYVQTVILDPLTYDMLIQMEKHAS